MTAFFVPGDLPRLENETSKSFRLHGLQASRSLRGTTNSIISVLKTKPRKSLEFTGFANTGFSVFILVMCYIAFGV